MKPSVGLLFILGTELKSEFEVLLNLLSLLPSKIIAGSQIDNWSFLTLFLFNKYKIKKGKLRPPLPPL